MKRAMLILLVLMMTLPVFACAESDAVRLTVSGEATVSISADTAVVTLGVRENSEEIKDAQSAVNEKIAAVRAALNELGIENADIATDSLYIYANYDYSSDGEGRVVSYTANNSLRVTVRDINSTGAAIDAAFEAGANTLDNVSFCASDDSAARDQAYQSAVASAMHKAEVIADAAGMRCAAIESISEGAMNAWNDAGNYAVVEEAAADMAKGAPTDIQASGVLVSATVSITFQLEDK